jgi:hypothetical protein
VIGFFLWSAARAELRQSDVDAALHGRRAGDLVGELPVPIDVDRALDTVDEQALARGRDLLPVTADGRLVGVIPVVELAELHPTDRSVRSASQVMEPVDHLPFVDLDAGVRELIAGFAGDRRAVQVGHDGVPTAVVTEREVALALQALRQQGPGHAPRPASPLARADEPRS